QVEALRISDRIAVMNEGRIVQIGPPAEVMNHPVDAFIASFVGVETIIEGRVIKCERGTATIAIDYDPTAPTETKPESAEVSLLEAAGQVRPGEQVFCCIRPEHITIYPSGQLDRSSARNAFPVIIDRIIPAGPFHKVHLQGGFPLVAYVTVQSIEELDLRPGSTVIASFKATAVHIIRRG
ncbi:MAG: TOBE domain-containing protein, partial [Syntrophus sp. (in: bacteria)]